MLKSLLYKKFQKSLSRKFFPLPTHHIKPEPEIKTQEELVTFGKNH